MTGALVDSVALMRVALAVCRPSLHLCPLSCEGPNANDSDAIVKYLSPATSTAIIRCPRASYRLVWTAITHLSHVPEYTPGSGYAGKRAGAMNRPCVFRVVRVSGTMRKAEEEAIRRGRREVARVRGAKEGVVLGGLFGEDAAGDDVGVGVEDVDMDDDDNGDDSD